MHQCWPRCPLSLGNLSVSTLPLRWRAHNTYKWTGFLLCQSTQTSLYNMHHSWVCQRATQGYYLTQVCRLEQPGIEPPAFQTVDDLLSSWTTASQHDKGPPTHPFTHSLSFIQLKCAGLLKPPSRMNPRSDLMLHNHNMITWFLQSPL